MIDTWRAIRGKKCPWCHDLPTGLLGRFYNWRYKVSPPWLRYIMRWWMFAKYKPKPWRIGLEWHIRRHEGAA